MQYVFGEFELDALLFQLRRGGTVVKLEPKVFDVLDYLIRHRERVVSKDELLAALWPGEFVSESVLPRCIAAARKALGDTRARPSTIATIHGRGYRFVAEVRDSVAADAAAASSPAPSHGGAGEPARTAPFVGREEIMARMTAALEQVIAGEGRMLLLVGEPGIGKTRTADELAAEARRCGARIVKARCHEGAGAPAYWPWVQILRGCLRGRDPDLVRRELGAAAADIALLVPEASAPEAAAAPRLPSPAAQPFEELGAQPSADAARFHLFDAVAAFLRDSSEGCPLVLLLDDLHWADQPSLMLLQHLAREMRESRLLVIGTYRDVELRRHHPLVRTLGDLARETLCERLHLRGLAKGDVSRFLAARAGAPASDALVAAVHEMTEGNPFFIGEIAGVLEAEGRLRAAAEPEAWSIVLPQSVREAIGRRLDGLSEACNRVLAVTSVVGRDFDLGLLKRVLAAARSAEDAAEPPALLEHLEEAVAAHILTAESPALGRFAFVHALVRQTLYEALPIPLRLRLHQRVAEVLEALHAGNLEPHLAEIAHHMFQSAAAGNAAKAIEFSTRAARRAYEQLAYEEAALQYERALQLLDSNPALEAAGLLRFDVLLALADALSISGARERSQENSRRAAAIARKLGRADLLAQAALVFGQRTEAGPLPAQELRSLLEEALAALGESQAGLRARLLSRLSSTSPYQDSIETRASMSRQAVELAREAGDEPALFDAMAAQLWALLGPDDDDERLRAADEYTRLVERSGGRDRLLIAHEHRGRSFLAFGDLPAADRETEAYERLAEDLRQPSYLLFAKWYWVARALGDGRLGEAEVRMRDCFALGRRIQHPATSGMLLWHHFWASRQRGDVTQLVGSVRDSLGSYGDVFGPRIDVGGLMDVQSGIDSLVQQFSFGGPFLPSVATYIYFGAGREEAARRAFTEVAAQDFADVPRDEWWMPTISHLAEVAAGLGEERACAALYRLLEPFAARNASHSLLRTYAGSTAHFLGLLAAALRRPADAARHFEAAVQQNAVLGARPALARTQYEYGRLLAAGQRSARRRAAEVLEEAHASALDMGLDGLAARIQNEILNSP